MYMNNILRILLIAVAAIASIFTLPITIYAVDINATKETNPSKKFSDLNAKNKQANNGLDRILSIFKKRPRKPPNSGDEICWLLPSSSSAQTSSNKPLIAWSFQEDVIKIEIKDAYDSESAPIFVLNDNSILQRGYILPDDYPRDFSIPKGRYYLIVTLNDGTQKLQYFRIDGFSLENHSSVDDNFEQYIQGLIDQNKIWDAYNLAFSIKHDSRVAEQKFHSELLTDLKNKSCK